MQHDKQLLFSPVRAAQVLDISRSTVYTLMRTGRLSYIQIGSDRRIPASELERIALEGAPKAAV